MWHPLRSTSLMASQLLMISFLTLCAPVFALPMIQHPVTDQAEVLTGAEEDRIADLLLEHQQRTGVQIAVLTVLSTGGVPIEDFSHQVAQSWGGGSQGRDDGILYVLAVNDHRMRIEVAYGLEPLVTDGEARRIQDAIKSELRAEKYADGIIKVVQTLIGETGSLRPGQKLSFMNRLRLKGNSVSRWIGRPAIAFMAGFFLSMGLLFYLIALRPRIEKKLIAPPAEGDVFRPTKTFLKWTIRFVMASPAVAVWVVVFWPFEPDFWPSVAFGVGTWHALTIGLLLGRLHKVSRSAPIALLLPVPVLIAIMIAVDSQDEQLVWITVMEMCAFFPSCLWALGYLSGSSGRTYGSSYSGSSSAGSSSRSYSSSSSSSRSYSSSSSSSRSSSSSNRSSYSGGGGRFGGGGASSSW